MLKKIEEVEEQLTVLRGQVWEYTESTDTEGAYCCHIHTEDGVIVVDSKKMRDFVMGIPELMKTVAYHLAAPSLDAVRRYPIQKALEKMTGQAFRVTQFLVD